MFALVVLLFALLSLLAIVYPFFAPQNKGLRVLPNIGEASHRQKLREQKASLMLVFKELDFDYETGKLSKEDYKDLREKYEIKAAQVMKELDAVEAQWLKWERSEFQQLHQNGDRV